MFYNKKIFHRCFCYPARYWYKNLTQIPRYFKEIHYLIKHGYDCSAVWDHYVWFIDCTRDIMNTYKEKHYGFGIIDESADSDVNEKLWEDMIDNLIEFLNKMDEDTYFTEDKPFGDLITEISHKSEIPMETAVEKHMKSYKQMEIAKDRFFELYSKYFYYLWD